VLAPSQVVHVVSPGSAGGVHQEARGVVARIAEGDAAAVGLLYDAYAQTLFTYALRLVGHQADAEDVVQDVFTQAWRQAARYDATRATVVGWLLMMTRTRALDRLRAQRARPDQVVATPPPEIPSGGPGQEVRVLTEEAIGRLRNALDALDEPLRTPIELAYYEGLSQSAIAERLGQPLGTVKTRMRTALMRLRDRLRSERVE
jgi:RNA polymerase sigma-70 factor (ECF subfamily)